MLANTSEMEYTIDKTTSENDNVKHKIYNTSNASYKILNKSVQSDDDSLNSYRSIILDPVTDRIMCFSPPKSVTLETFASKCPYLTGVTANVIVEGTMMNLFYDPRIESWELASKSAVGCNYWYFRTQYAVNNRSPQFTFRDMFVDALRAPFGTMLNDIPLIQTLDKSCVYSFVVQHPYNHIVLPIEFPAIYLIAIYRVETDTKIRTMPLKLDEADGFANSSVLFPVPCYVDAYEYIHMLDYTHVGIMLYHAESGLRTSIVNPQYTSMKEFRGNNPNLQYQYLCVSRAGKVKEYLEAFPMYKQMFYDSIASLLILFARYITHMLRILLRNWVRTYRSRNLYSDTFVNSHNEIYLPSICDGGGVIVTCKVVADYFNAMEPKEQLYHLNYQNRKIV